MKLNFKGIKFNDYNNIVAVFKNRYKKRFYFDINIKTVKNIIEFVKNKKIPDLENNLYFYLIKNNKIKINSITIDKYYNNKYFGSLLLNSNYKISLTLDEIILFSLYFDIKIKINPFLFYQVFDKKIKKYIQKASNL